MASKMQIELALIHLETGKFSFRMVDAIKEHVDKLENELNVVRSLHASAINDLRQQELANWRLEDELRKANAKMRALLRANMLTEKAFQGMTAVAITIGDYVQVVKNHALPRATMLMERALQELASVAPEVSRYFHVLRKYVGASLEKATTYLTNLHKTAA